jgi:hypothetical protein
VRVPFTAFAMFAAVACSEPSTTSDLRTASSDDASPAPKAAGTRGPDDADEGTDEPAYVNASYLSLSCKSQAVDLDAGRFALGCDLLTNGGVKAQPEDVAASYQWTYTAPSGVAAEIVEGTDPNGPTVVFTFGGQTATKLSEVVGVELTFAYVDKTTHADEKVSQRAKDILAGLAEQSRFRIVFDSIRAHDPARPVQAIDLVEFKVDGKWEPVTLAGGNGAGYWTVVDATADDYTLLSNLFGQTSPALLPDAFPRYAPTAPNDAVGQPLILQYSFGKPVSITGIRYNGGATLANQNVVTGFPDALHFETSGDGVTWRVVPGSRINSDTEKDGDILQYFWNGFEAPAQ